MNRPLKQAACSWSYGPMFPLRYLAGPKTDVWLHDGSPSTCRNDTRRAVVGQPREVARNTPKECLCGTIRFRHVPTDETRPRRIPGIDQDDGHTRQCGLVLHIGPKLAECPIAVARPLALPNRCPLPYAVEVFESDTASCALCAAHHSLGDAVIRIGLIARLTPPQQAQFARRRACLLALEIPPAVSDLPAGPFDGIARVDGAFRIDGDVHDAEIDTEIVLHVIQRNVWHVQRGVQVEHAVSQDEVGLTTQAIAPGLLVAAESAGNHLPASETQEADVLQPMPGHDSFVVGQRTMRAERGLNALVPLVRLNHLGDGPDGHLRRQSKARPHVIVDTFLEGKLARQALLECDLSDGVTRRIESFERADQRRVLLRGGRKFDRQGLPHDGDYTAKRSIRRVPTASLPQAFLRPVNRVASCLVRA